MWANKLQKFFQISIFFICFLAGADNTSTPNEKKVQLDPAIGQLPRYGSKVNLHSFQTEKDIIKSGFPSPKIHLIQNYSVLLTEKM